MQCYAPCAILSDRTFFLQRLCCVGFESIICIFAACANIRTFVMWKLEWVLNTCALVRVCNIRTWFKGGNLVHTLSLENTMVVFMESGKAACTKLGLLLVYFGFCFDFGTPDLQLQCLRTCNHNLHKSVLPLPRVDRLVIEYWRTQNGAVRWSWSFWTWCLKRSCGPCLVAPAAI
jgi:hypothetical protein